MKPWIAFLGTVALIASVATPGRGSTDPAIGTWSLDVGKSKYEPGPAPKSEMRTYESMPDGTIRLTIHINMADGTSVTQTTTYRRDGSPHIITNNPNIDSIETLPGKGGGVRTTYFRAGKVVGHMTTAYSKDRSVLTMTQTLTRPSGQSEHDVRVYERR